LTGKEYKVNAGGVGLKMGPVRQVSNIVVAGLAQKSTLGQRLPTDPAL